MSKICIVFVLLLSLLTIGCQVDTNHGGKINRQTISDEDVNSGEVTRAYVEEGYEMKTFSQQNSFYSMSLDYPESTSQIYQQGVKRLNEKVFRVLDEMNAEFKRIPNDKDAYKEVSEIPGKTNSSRELHKMQTLNAEMMYFDNGLASYLYTYDMRYADEKKSTYFTGYINFDLELSRELQLADFFQSGFEDEFTQLVNLKIDKLSNTTADPSCYFKESGWRGFEKFTFDETFLYLYFSDFQQVIVCNTAVIKIPLSLLTDIAKHNGPIAKILPVI